VKTLIKNCRIITPFEVVDGYCITLAGTTISGLIPEAWTCTADYDQVLDCKEYYAAPGFIDLHNHGNSGYDVMDATPQALEAIAEFHLKSGVTGFLAATITQEKKEITAAIKNIVSFAKTQKSGGVQKTPGSRLLGIYLEGPYFSPKRKGAQAAEYLKTPDCAELEDFLELAENHLKVVALAPELPGAVEAVNYLKKKGITVAAGHTDATYDQIRQAVEEGTTLATHLFNGMRGFTHREPGPPGALLLEKRVSCELICDGIHLHPAAVDLVVRLKGPSGVVLISDAMRATGLGDGHFTLGGQDVLVSDGIARLTSNQRALAGSTLTLDRAVYNVMTMAKLPIEDAVRMATYNPAQVIGVAERRGSIEPGKAGEIVVFDEQVRIKHVIIDGEILSF